MGKQQCQILQCVQVRLVVLEKSVIEMYVLFIVVLLATGAKGLIYQETFLTPEACVAKLQEVAPQIPNAVYGDCFKVPGESA